MTLIPRKKAKSGRSVERFTLSAAQATAKEVTLVGTPESSNAVVLDLPNGTVQRVGVDYILTGQVISWDGYGLETVLSEDDHIIVTY